MIEEDWRGDRKIVVDGLNFNTRFAELDADDPDPSGIE